MSGMKFDDLGPCSDTCKPGDTSCRKCWCRDVGGHLVCKRPNKLITLGRPLLKPLDYTLSENKAFFQDDSDSHPKDEDSYHSTRQEVSPQRLGKSGTAAPFASVFGQPVSLRPGFQGGGHMVRHRLLGASAYSDRTSYSSSSSSFLPKHRDGGSEFDIPEEFDWRTKTGEDGGPLLLPVRDQGECGGCYAITTAQMLGHRFSIATKGRVRTVLSAQDMINCGPTFIRDTFKNPQYNETLKTLYKQGVLVEANWYALQGCEGGLLVSALDYAVIYGLVEESQQPYKGRAGKCQSVENRKSQKRWFGKRTHALTWGREDGLPAQDVKLDPKTLKKNIQNMQLAILKDGPIVASMNLYSDFIYYPRQGEVYQRDRSTIVVNGRQEQVKYEGGHAVLIVGWGRFPAGPNGVEAWVVENTWGTSFGKQGYFYIKRGSNLSNIEYDAYGLYPNLEGEPVASMPENVDEPLEPGEESTAEGGSSLSTGGLVAILVVVILVVLSAVFVGIFVGLKKKPSVMVVAQ